MPNMSTCESGSPAPPPGQEGLEIKGDHCKRGSAEPPWAVVVSWGLIISLLEDLRLLPDLGTGSGEVGFLGGEWVVSEAKPLRPKVEERTLFTGERSSLYRLGGPGRTLPLASSSSLFPSWGFVHEPCMLLSPGLRFLPPFPVSAALGLPCTEGELGSQPLHTLSALWASSVVVGDESASFREG